MICELTILPRLKRLSFFQPTSRNLFLVGALFVCFGFVNPEIAHPYSSDLPENYISEAGAADSSSYVMLHWKIAKNEQVDHFEIERMDVHGQYKTIALILSDNEATTSAYLYKDRITVRDLHLFYRIKAIDLAGKSFFSEVLPLELKSAGKERIGVSYQLNDVGIGLMLPALQGNYVCRMYNKAGKMVKLKNVSIANNHIAVNDLATGPYFMELYHPKTGKRFYTQFSKE
jgi:hypothetical protein